MVNTYWYVDNQPLIMDDNGYISTMVHNGFIPSIIVTCVSGWDIDNGIPMANYSAIIIINII
jgi:hypothetical protein